MQTLLEILQKTTAYFAARGIANPKLNAELLLAHVLGLRRLDLYLQFDRPLPADKLDALRPLVARRGKREPLEYLTGSRPFVDLDLACSPAALIPRSETEELVELLAARFAASPPARVLDLGTGTGALALSLAKLWPESAVTAVDFSADTLALAEANAGRNNLGSNLTFLRSDWFSALQGSTATTATAATPNAAASAGGFDLIVSNPPYLTEAEWQQADPEVRDYEPRHALIAAEDGIADLRKILTEAPRFLNTGGLLALETGIAHHDRLAAIATATGAYAATESVADSDQRPRFFLARTA